MVSIRFMNYFSNCCDPKPEWKQLGDEGCDLAHSLRRDSLLWCRRHGSGEGGNSDELVFSFLFNLGPYPREWCWVLLGFCFLGVVV